MTLQECFEAAGSVFPFRVRHDKWDKEVHFNIVAKTPKDAWVGWFNTGDSDAVVGENEAWQLYTEPKAKKKYIPYLISRVVSDVIEIAYYSVDADIVPGRRHPSLPDIEVDE
jgi:hypothetical protein